MNYFSYYLRNKHQIHQDVNFFFHTLTPLARHAMQKTVA